MNLPVAILILGVELWAAAPEFLTETSLNAHYQNPFTYSVLVRDADMDNLTANTVEPLPDWLTMTQGYFIEDFVGGPVAVSKHPRDGVGSNAFFGSIYDLAMGPDSNLYVFDSRSIRKIDMNGNVSTLYTHPTYFSFTSTPQFAVSPDTAFFLLTTVSTSSYVNGVLTITRSSTIYRFKDGEGFSEFAQGSNLLNLQMDFQGNLLASSGNSILKFAKDGSSIVVATTSSALQCFAVHPDGSIVFSNYGRLYAIQPDGSSASDGVLIASTDVDIFYSLQFDIHGNLYYYDNASSTIIGVFSHSGSLRNLATVPTQASIFTVDPSGRIWICSGTTSISSIQNLVKLQGTPSAQGAYPITLQVTDGTTSLSKSLTIPVSKGKQSIQFPSLSIAKLKQAALSLGASATSGLEVNYTSSDETVATISGNTVTLVGPGTTTITASQAGNSDFEAATPVKQRLLVQSQNTAPTFSSTPITKVSVDSLYQYIVRANDVDGDPFHFSANGTLPTWLSFSTKYLVHGSGYIPPKTESYVKDSQGIEYIIGKKTIWKRTPQGDTSTFADSSNGFKDLAQATVDADDNLYLASPADSSIFKIPRTALSPFSSMPMPA